MHRAIFYVLTFSLSPGIPNRSDSFSRRKQRIRNSPYLPGKRSYDSPDRYYPAPSPPFQERPSDDHRHITAGQPSCSAVSATDDDQRMLFLFIRQVQGGGSIFRTVSAIVTSPRQKKLVPAVRYLLNHLTKGIDCRTLAELCALSTAQFYNLFHAEYGMAPLEYRDHLLMRRATLLLKDGSFSVTKVAETLGFESVSYFSRFFKKHKGLSPAAYIKKKAGEN